MTKLNVKKGDTVVVISGKDKGKQGKILVSYPDKDRVVVQNANMITKHVKPRRQGAIHVSNVKLVCPKCGKVTRVGHEVKEVTISGVKKMKSVRVCKECGAQID